MSFYLVLNNKRKREVERTTTVYSERIISSFRQTTCSDFGKLSERMIIYHVERQDMSMSTVFDRPFFRGRKDSAYLCDTYQFRAMRGKANDAGV